MRWDHREVLLFLTELSVYQDRFHRVPERSEIFKKVGEAMARRNYTFTVQELRKKFNNLNQTYKVIVDKKNTSGEGTPSAWPYFEVSMF